MKRTAWYPASVKPVRVGWYEYWIPYLDTDWVMAFWTGETWLERVPGRESPQPLEPLPDGQWRGLAQPSDERREG